MGWWGFREYVSAAERRAKAARKIKALEKQGRKISPVVISGRKIATTFWGCGWCDHLESFSDYENRLPRGRTYVRNGSVIDLQLKPGEITALVSGSDIYNITIKITPLDRAAWKRIKSSCSGRIGSLIELLQGKLADDVMQVVAHREEGLFPKSREIKMLCSCPDGAYMCKHLAAVLYGVGARLDVQPELLFVLRCVDHLELIDAAGDAAVVAPAAKGKKTIAAGELADVFGIELEPTAETSRAEAPAPALKRGKRGARSLGTATTADKPVKSGRKRKAVSAAATQVAPQPEPVSTTSGRSRSRLAGRSKKSTTRARTKKRSAP